jgi:outer membrane lipoprotein SlyB
MTSTNIFNQLVGLAALLALSGCETMNSTGSMSNPEAPYYRASSSDRTYSGRGTVQSIELMRQDNARSGLGLGTIAGAVVGGIVGNEIGSGSSNTAGMVVGAAGGAYVGHALEKRERQSSDAYRFTIRMSDGGHQTLIQSSNPDIRVGDRVQIDNGVLRRY